MNQNKILVSLIIVLIILTVILAVVLGRKSFQTGNPIQPPSPFIVFPEPAIHILDFSMKVLVTP